MPPSQRSVCCRLSAVSRASMVACNPDRDHHIRLSYRVGCEVDDAVRDQQCVLTRTLGSCKLVFALWMTMVAILLIYTSHLLMKDIDSCRLHALAVWNLPRICTPQIRIMKFIVVTYFLALPEILLLPFFPSRGVI